MKQTNHDGNSFNSVAGFYLALCLSLLGLAQFVSSYTQNILFSLTAFSFIAMCIAIGRNKLPNVLYEVVSSLPIRYLAISVGFFNLAMSYLNTEEWGIWKGLGIIAAMLGFAFFFLYIKDYEKLSIKDFTKKEARIGRWLIIMFSIFGAIKGFSIGHSMNVAAIGMYIGAMTGLLTIIVIVSVARTRTNKTTPKIDTVKHRFSIGIIMRSTLLWIIIVIFLLVAIIAAYIIIPLKIGDWDWGIWQVDNGWNTMYTVATALMALFILIAGIFTGYQLRENIKQRREQAWGNILSHWREHDHRNLLRYIYNDFDFTEKSDLDDWRRNRTKELEMVEAVLSSCERISLMVLKRYVSTKDVQETIGHAMVDCYHQCRPFIKARQEERSRKTNTTKRKVATQYMCHFEKFIEDNENIIHPTM